MTAVPEYRSVFEYCLQDSALQDLREVTGIHEPPEHTQNASHGQNPSHTQNPSHGQNPSHTQNASHGHGDMSSISGSDSEQEEPDGDWAVGNAEAGPLQKDDSVLEEESFGRLSNRVVFQNSQGQYLAVYRCILQSKEDLVASLQSQSSIKEDLVASLQSLNNKTMWVILMAGGGHFAGAVFQGRDVLQHKTFHRYTVRAKRGTSQGLRDAKSSSHAPKSAGAALRRYNEAALVKATQILLF
ncbi:unnamed protein product [Coregonus sp. 'balchen']|nr:unnamed protein product [Coregonus sp. 'balchen']